MKSVLHICVFVALALVMSSDTHAQTVLRRSVMGSGGVLNAKSGTMSMHGTLGQPVIGIVRNGSQILSQGFWTPFSKITSVNETGFAPIVSGITTFPNPVETEANLRFVQPQPGVGVLRIYNTGGELMKEFRNVTLVAGENEVVWNLRDMDGRVIANGTYLAEVELLGTEVPGRQNRLRGMITVVR